MHHHSHNTHCKLDKASSRRSFVTGLFAASVIAPSGFPQSGSDATERFRRMSQDAEQKGLAEPFRGITKDGNVTPGLFPVHSTGASTDAVRNAAEQFLATLSADQRTRTLYPVDDPEWRK